MWWQRGEGFKIWGKVKQIDANFLIFTMFFVTWPQQSVCKTAGKTHQTFSDFMAKHVKVPVFANTIPYKNALRKLPCQYRRPGVKSVSIPSQMEFAITT